jgi:hypothetical protein
MGLKLHTQYMTTKADGDLLSRMKLVTRSLSGLVLTAPDMALSWKACAIV